MKKVLLLLMLILPIISFAQNYSFKNGGGILQNGILISPEEVRQLLVTNQPALQLYDAGRSKKTIGNVLLYGGGTIFSYALYKTIYPNVTYKQYGGYGSSSTVFTDDTPKPVVGITGIVLMLAAIPVKIGFSNKIRQAVTLMNE